MSWYDDVMVHGRMVSLAVAIALTAAVLLSSCRKNATPATSGAASVEAVSLQDVQALFGGQNVWVSSNGNVIAQVVEPGQREKRYELTLKPGEFAEIEKLLVKHAFYEIHLKERSGSPDEARPTIAVTTKDGTVRVVSKWANDTHPGFDAIYKELMALVERATKVNKLLHEGEFDDKWRPDGWR